MFYFVCMSILAACVNVYHVLVFWCLQRLEESTGSLGTGDTDSCECWEPNPGPLQKQQTLLSTDPSLSLPINDHIKGYNGRIPAKVKVINTLSPNNIIICTKKINKYANIYNNVPQSPDVLKSHCDPWIAENPRQIMLLSIHMHCPYIHNHKGSIYWLASL